MRNILVPTDFSTTARNAYLYAMALANHLNGTLEVVHFCHPSNHDANQFLIPSLEKILAFKKKKLDEFVHTPKSDSIEGLVEEEMIDKELILGFANTELQEMSKRADVDLIVMGTTGENRLLAKVFGSISSQVCQQAHCPVWLVPPGGAFKGINNILYASNFESADKAMMDRIIKLAKPFAANIHLVHVNETKNKGNYELEEILLEKMFRKAAPSLAFRMGTVHSETVWKGLYEYAEEQAIDLIVLVNRRRTFLDKLFHKSHTKAMVLNAKVPLLVLHMDDKKI